MKILVVYASAGAGHYKAAEAIYHCFRQNHKETEARLVDVLDYTSLLEKLSYTFGYTFLINHALFLWSFFFWLTEVKPLRSLTKAAALFFDRLSTKKFQRLLISEKPDFIFSTHFMTSEIAVWLKEKKKISSKIITSITDFGVHPFWVYKDTDLYVVASEITKKELINQGVSEEIIDVLGIPIGEKFTREYEKLSLCQKLGIDHNKFTVLIVTGSFGLGPIEEVVELLHLDAQLLVVCARNKKLFAKLTKEKYPNCFVYGFVDNVHELMSVSDCIITKPGGLTIAEILVSGIVPIFISAIPGQEIGNINALKKLGIGEYPQNLSQIKNIILDFKSSPEKLNLMKERIAAVKKPGAAGVCNVIRKGCFRPSN